ncbi:MAG: AAA family ATPase [Endomicrobia bacterium]|nr:AAA family ATPase [Bacillota bacterium]MCL1971944.1 AAA family ATPase [Endomicrobiia bacterium]
MKRDIISKFFDWKNKKNRQPLILTGARQVGKTWAMKEFGAKNFKKSAYISFDNNTNMKNLFENSVRPNELLPFLNAEAGIEIDSETLVIFDEVQEVPKALTALKYFFEERPDIAIIAAGSTLGVSLHNGVSFPVGKVEFMTLHPMSFAEFLDAISETQLRTAIETKNYVLLDSFHEKLLGLVKQYMIVEGMPEVVSEFVRTKGFGETRNIQKKILTSYEKDFSKYTNVEMAVKLGLLWKSIPAQLARENKKFLYGAVKTGARARDFEVAIQWLADSSLIYKVGRISNPSLPLKSYEEFGMFKMFLHDIGLLCAMSGVSDKLILEANSIFKEFKGALVEQLICQELLTLGEEPFYWSVENSQAEIDFLIQRDDKVIPIEVKSGINLQAKSLKTYIEKFKPSIALRVSQANYKVSDNIIDLPIYAFRSWFQ